eukprot:15334619-Ditylum_brightwellii.AAC.1
MENIPQQGCQCKSSNLLIHTHDLLQETIHSLFLHKAQTMYLPLAVHQLNRRSENQLAPDQLPAAPSHVLESMAAIAIYILDCLSFLVVYPKSEKSLNIPHHLHIQKREGILFAQLHPLQPLLH